MDETKMSLLCLLSLILGVAVTIFMVAINVDVVMVRGQLPTAAVEYKGKLYKLVEMQP